ncbi:Receptor-like kinase [Quillaja saponaria]|uniref:Receptor-like kinase n=1 Tax=Quillaja saponaria TaxID=32244 RepID=A0AAD7LQD7_QUISA|nr:Receptor-like kinase [Quillaja saponaria]
MSYFLIFLLLLLCTSPSFSSLTELGSLMAIKASLDPENRLLTSWTPNSDPCSGAFEGVACNGQGRIANISLQGKGLSGQLSAAVAELKSLTGLYLHFNALNGKIPKEIVRLTELSDLYLNVNNLSGNIPREIGNMSNLQVLQLCYNKFTGSIPTELGNLRRLTVLALQYNQLNGAIPASLGELKMLTRLDLSFNSLFGSIPVKLADAPAVEVLDVRNNSLLGNVPPALKRLKGGFQYKNNPGLCGIGFSDLVSCKKLYIDPHRPEPFQPHNLSTKDLPESAALDPSCNNTHCMKPKSPHMGVVFGLVGVLAALTVSGLFMFTCYRRRKQKIGSAFDTSDSRLSTDQVKEVCRKGASALVSLEYSNGWDPLAKGRSGYSQEVLEGFMFNLEEVERATQCFSDMNLLGKSNFSAIYKGILRDGSVVAIKCIAKDKLQYLDVKNDRGKVLEWSTRVSIISGIAKGIGYLHGRKENKHILVHQNISAEKVLLDARYNPLLSDSGLHKLLADDIVFSTLKASAAMGYLAPEYTTTGRLTEKSDVYAFGVIIFQLLTGKGSITQLTHHGAETSSFEDFVDTSLDGKFSESEAAKLGRIALLCTQESSILRPSMDYVIQELGENIGS